jgi:hypothetical protein
MTDMVIDVSTDDLRSRAADLDRSARCAAEGLGRVPGLVVSAPGLAAAAALADLHAAVDAALGTAALDVARAAALVRTAAEDYVSTDERAAHRLARVG